jgi:hypothetical protein
MVVHILGQSTKYSSERTARYKALNQRVYISGLQGSHTLEVGVAYHYRGHFIYAYPAGNPIEPVSFSTKKGINIVGVVQDRAPIYDPQAPGLVPEGQISALNRACMHEQEFQKEQEEIRKQETKAALRHEAKQETQRTTVSAQNIDTTTNSQTRPAEPEANHPPLRVTSLPTLLVPRQVVSRHGSHTSLASLEAHLLTATSRKLTLSNPPAHHPSPPTPRKRFPEAIATPLMTAAAISLSPLPDRDKPPYQTLHRPRAQSHLPTVSASVAMAMARTSDPMRVRHV